MSINNIIQTQRFQDLLKKHFYNDKGSVLYMKEIDILRLNIFNDWLFVTYTVGSDQYTLHMNSYKRLVAQCRKDTISDALSAE